MTTEREYQELYDRLLDEVRTLHKNNRRRIRNGMRMLLVVTVGLMLLMFLAQGNKVFTLMLWIFSMFAVAAYLIAVEYADYELQKKLEQITQMEMESMGALLELPELPRMPRLAVSRPPGGDHGEYRDRVRARLRRGRAGTDFGGELLRGGYFAGGTRTDAAAAEPAGNAESSGYAESAERAGSAERAENAAGRRC